MSLNDPLAQALSAINNAENAGKTECIVRPISKTIKTVLKIFKDKDYIEDFKEISSARGGIIKVSLQGKITKCSVIKPRYPVKYSNLEKFEKRYLLAKNIGLIIISTSKGMILHGEAKDKKLGGRLIAYIY